MLGQALLLMGVLHGLSAGACADGGDGKKVYETRCAFCHGMEGRGDGPAGAALKPPATNFAAPDYGKSASMERIKDTIAQGRQGTAMIPFGKTLKPEEIDAVAQYVLGFAPK
jgi:high-affinity iron transporter